MNTVIYTAITNVKDELRENQTTDGSDFVAFLDNSIYSKTWKVCQSSSEFEDPVRNAKVHKILSHQYFPEYEYSLWIDGNIELKVPVQKLVDKYLVKADIAVFKHPIRNCIYVEAEKCKELDFDDHKVIDEQMARYRKEGFPEKYGLSENGVILRRHTERVKGLNEFWWNEIKNGSRRDQLSFYYAVWKTGLEPAYFPGQIRNKPTDNRQNGNDYFVWYKHRKYNI